MVLRLALICHAPTAATRTASFPMDEPLDGPGLEIIRASSRPFSSSARALTSPALAARQTAEALKLSAEIDPDLRDCDYGCWSGRSIEEVEATDPAGLGQWLSDPASSPHGGETLLALLSRVSAWLGARQGQSGPVIAITHVGIVRAAVLAALDAPPRAFWRIDVAPLSVTWLHGSRGVWTVSSTNQKLDRLRREPDVGYPVTP